MMTSAQPIAPLPLPNFFAPESISQVWRVPYQQRAEQAAAWAREYQIAPAESDRPRICLLLIDVQNTFCLRDFELYVAGRSGTGAIDDNVRLCEFIYRHLNRISQIVATMDTHFTLHVFHPLFWVDSSGNHPAPNTPLTAADLEAGTWTVNPEIVANFPGWDYADLEQYALHYARHLAAIDKYPLMVWPYHSKLGGIGHALVSAVEEALFFHSIARKSQTHYEIKGDNPLTENYSVFSAEVTEDHRGRPIASKNQTLCDRLLSFDAVIVAGQAKSHCVAWTIDDLLSEIQVRDRALARKIYLLEDCTSPVVVPGLDFTPQANAAFARFTEAGMHAVRSTDAIDTWPEFPLT